MHNFLSESACSVQAKATTTSREDEDDEMNQPSKKLEQDDGVLNESCFGHQTLHLLPILVNMIANQWLNLHSPFYPNFKSFIEILLLIQKFAFGSDPPSEPA